VKNAELEVNVADELFWDPKIDSTSIAVSADNGTVTLRGTVGSFYDKREARKAAERVIGVTNVKNDLEVRILTDDRREDADLRGAVLQALALDARVPNSVDVRANNGIVTLTGSVNWQYQRDEAEFVAGNVLGVAGVQDDITITAPTPSGEDVAHWIKKAMVRDARLDADGLDIGITGGSVTLIGTVSSWPEHDAAMAAAWAAPGVTNVNDRIAVVY
jgi:osmotically-inducible protein OsmY